MKQIDLARRVGISASYLNLIERNKRGIGGALLTRIGRELSLSVDDLDGSAERRLGDQLRTLAEDPEYGGADLRADSIEEYIARYPAWARATSRIFGGLQDTASQVDRLSDRLAHDPVLSDAVHEMLTEITALRSTAEILNDPREISAEQRRRFEGIVDEQSARLAQTCSGLANYFDRLTQRQHSGSAIAEAEEFLFRSGGAAGLEPHALSLRSSLTAAGRDLEHALAAIVAGEADVKPEWGRVRRLAVYARAYAGMVEVPELKDVLSGCPVEAVPETRRLLHEYLADAIRLPARRLLHLGGLLNWDVDRLAAAEDGDAGLVFRRIAALHREDAPRAAYVCADASGATLVRGGDLDLLPRPRELECPIWPVHRAAADKAIMAMISLPDGESRVAAARSEPEGMATHMLVFAGDAFAEPMGLPALNAGPACRICTHTDCRARRERSIIDV